jgi:pyruvate/2-oxoglutarate dehydrogenase complex dihydrolipoamide dehydrogenase (E3) component
VVEKDGAAVAELSARHVVIATGARARGLPGLEPDGKVIWTYKEAMLPEHCRARCWSSAPARSASSSRASITTWEPT